jgi:hypothetical protein
MYPEQQRINNARNRLIQHQTLYGRRSNDALNQLSRNRRIRRWRYGRRSGFLEPSRRFSARNYYGQNMYTQPLIPTPPPGQYFETFDTFNNHHMNNHAPIPPRREMPRPPPFVNRGGRRTMKRKRKTRQH